MLGDASSGPEVLITGGITFRSCCSCNTSAALRGLSVSIGTAGSGIEQLQDQVAFLDVQYPGIGFWEIDPSQGGFEYQSTHFRGTRSKTPDCHFCDRQ